MPADASCPMWEVRTEIAGSLVAIRQVRPVGAETRQVLLGLMTSLEIDSFAFAVDIALNQGEFMIGSRNSHSPFVLSFLGSRGSVLDRTLARNVGPKLQLIPVS